MDRRGLLCCFCHPERSEGPRFLHAPTKTWNPRLARNDKAHYLMAPSCDLVPFVVKSLAR